MLFGVHNKLQLLTFSKYAQICNVFSSVPRIIIKMSIDYRLGKPKSKKITPIADIPEKYLPEWYLELRKDRNLVIDGITAMKAVEAATNRMEAEKQAKLDAKRYEEEQRLMEQQQKQEAERRKQREEYRNHLPQRQLEMFLTGKRHQWPCCHRFKQAEFFNHSKTCDYPTGEDIEPGLRLLKQLHDTGRLMIVDEKTANRLAEFAIPDETHDQLLNRLLDIAAIKAKPQSQRR
jgi:hypothetical protein